MRIVYLLIVLACLALAGCGDGDFEVDRDDNGENVGGGDGGGNVGQPSDLTALVLQECNQTPEDRDAIAIDGLAFAPGADDPNNQAFSNNCL